MLDIRYIRQHAEELKQNIVNRRLNPEQANVDRLLTLDKERLELLKAFEELQHERNEAASRKDAQKGKEIKERLKDVEPRLAAVTAQWQELMDWMPNVTHPSMPVGKDSSGNKEIKTGGVKRQFSFTPKDHLTLGERLDLIDVKRAANISGSRFYFLKNEGALLHWGLMQLAFQKLVQRGFIPVITPVVVKRKPLYGTGYFPAEESQIYRIEKGNVEGGEDLFLTGTSEQAIVAYEADCTLAAKELPKKYVGYSPCFRSEAGSWGKDVRGIKRVHQFSKVEMIYFTTPETSQQCMQEALAIEEELLGELGLPYHVLEMCTGDVGLATHRKFDLEVWMPSQNDWMEVMSNSDLAQYHARRLNIKYKTANGTTDYVHTVSATALTNTRPIAAILERYQEENGTVTVPEVLRPYVGKNVIGK